MNPNKPNHLQQAGFSLIEVMVALLIFMVIFLGLAKSEVSVLWSQSRTSMRDQALRLAEDELTRLRGEQFTLTDTASSLSATTWTTPDEITVGMRSGSAKFYRSIQITDIASSVMDLKRVDVVIGWNDNKMTATKAPTNKNIQLCLSTILVQGE